MTTTTQSNPTGVHSFEGSCHCGAVKYQTDLDLGGQLITCNCSMCGRAGTILTFVTPDHFTLKSGEDALASYEFNRHAIVHKFCKHCGIKPFAMGSRPDGQKMVAVNVRCLEGVEVASLTPTPVDGRSF